MKTSKKKKPQKRTTWKRWILFGILAVVVILLSVLIVRTVTDRENEPQDGLSTDAPVEAFSPIDLGEGLILTGLSGATGNFPEDGSGDFVVDMLSATFRNDGTKTLQYAKIYVTVDGTVYTFEITTLPVGKTLRAFDMNKTAAPKTVKTVSAEAEHLAFFSEEPTLDADRLAITVKNGAVTVKNISNEDINTEISIYFKAVSGSTYMGGITYRVRIGALKAGAEVSGYSSHASAKGTEVLFVTYGQS